MTEIHISNLGFVEPESGTDKECKLQILYESELNIQGGSSWFSDLSQIMGDMLNIKADSVETLFDELSGETLQDVPTSITPTA
jgi:hypothetical protein